MPITCFITRLRLTAFCGVAAVLLAATSPAAAQTITVTVVGSGTVKSPRLPGRGRARYAISCPSKCGATFASGATVNLTASPACDWIFSGWSGGEATGNGGLGGGFQMFNGNTEPLPVTLGATSNANVTATFILNTIFPVKCK
jgi:hypothetical protein